MPSAGSLYKWSGFAYFDLQPDDGQRCYSAEGKYFFLFPTHSVWQQRSCCILWAEAKHEECFPILPPNSSWYPTTHCHHHLGIHYILFSSFCACATCVNNSMPKSYEHISVTRIRMSLLSYIQVCGFMSFEWIRFLDLESKIFYRFCWNWPTFFLL